MKKVFYLKGIIIRVLDTFFYNMLETNLDKRQNLKLIILTIINTHNSCAKSRTKCL